MISLILLIITIYEKEGPKHGLPNQSSSSDTHRAESRQVHLPTGVEFEDSTSAILYEVRTPESMFVFIAQDTGGSRGV